MRKLILIIALTTVPLGIWTAGCRNDDRQAAFPDTPELRSLARSDEQVSEVATSAPVIPAKPIDREILHYPDNGTLARVRAVNDRANTYASETAGRGLFTLPEENNYVAAAPKSAKVGSAGRNARAAVPAPSAREFWSKPMAARSDRSDRSDSDSVPQRERSIPADVSAMAAPAGDPDNALFLPPAPSAAPARRPAQDGMLILPPADLPGVFTPGDVVDLDDSGDLGDAGEALFEAAPARSAPRRWLGNMFRRDRGDARSAPPAPSRRERIRPADRPAEVTQYDAMPEFMPVPAPASALTTPGREAFPPIPAGARIVSSEGMDFEPLPEPIPLSQYNSMVMDELANSVPNAALKAAPKAAPAAKTPAAKKSDLLSAPILPLPAALISGKVDAPAPTPTIPELTKTKANTTANTAATKLNTRKFADAKTALEPLPDLTALAPTPGKSAMKGKAVTLPAPMPAELPTPEAAAAKAALLLSPEAMDEAFEELDKEDFFKADFWEPAAKTKAKQPDPGKAPEKKQPALPAIPELTDPAASASAAASFIPLPPPLIGEEPKKIVLQPTRKAGTPMEKIDAATEVPPLKF